MLIPRDAISSPHSRRKRAIHPKLGDPIHDPLPLTHHQVDGFLTQSLNQLESTVSHRASLSECLEELMGPAV